MQFNSQHLKKLADLSKLSLESEDEAELKKMGYSTSIILPLTCLQTIMFKEDTYYGYGDFRRVDALASGDINDW